MNHSRLLTAGLAAWLSAGPLGCFPQQTSTSTSRSQVAEDATDKAELSTIGERTIVSNSDPIPVFGIGLVHNLRGTGSSPPPGEHRTALETMIVKMKGRPKELLDDPNKSTSLVLVSAIIPPGCRNGDKVDVTITLPPGSKTTSLKGGVLFPCDLANYELAGNVRQAMTAAGMPSGKAPVASDLTPLMGNRMVIAEGALIAGSAERAEKTDDDSGPAELKVGKIWSGGKALMDRPYYFLMSDGGTQPRLALVVAERINSVFHATGDRYGKVAEAKVQGKPLVVAHVPPAYRLNHGRFLLVARQVPLVPLEPGSPYRQQLEHDLVRPESALTAAIKLEALGADSRQALRVGLQSESPWVRFASAEALAYLGHPDGAKDLAELAEKHPAMRTHCLTALASMDDGACADLLADLMKKPDAQLRYGAFVALRSADPSHEAIRGKLMNQSYWLHTISADAEPEQPLGSVMIHVAAQRRAEIVIFGSVCPMSGDFSIPLGNDFTVTSKNDGTVTVTRVTVKDGEPTAIPLKCRADLGHVLTAIAELGGTYTEAVELVQRLDKAAVLAGSVAYDSAPRGLTVQQLAQIARSDPSVARADLEVERAGKTEILQASYDLPTEADAVQAKPEEPTLPPLNREPGRIFGPSPKK